MYGKIFDSIYEGSLYGQWEAIVTMQQLIVLANADGIVDMTPPAIAGKTSIPLEIIEKGLEILAEPDPYSRTQDHDGVRITLIDDHKPWGWLIVNHEKYTNMTKREDKRKADRDRIAAKRKSMNLKDVAKCRKTSQGVANVAHEDEDVDEYVEVKEDNLNIAAWDAYVDHRKDIKAKRLTEQGTRLAQKKLAQLTPDEQMATVELSIANGWTGLFPEKRNETHKRPDDFATIHARNRRIAGLD